jgi:hypothetical protein
VLQERAQDEGGDAIVDIVSITRRKKTESASEFRCVAGALIVHVGLRGTIVRLGATKPAVAAPAAAPTEAPDPAAAAAPSLPEK